MSWFQWTDARFLNFQQLVSKVNQYILEIYCCHRDLILIPTPAMVNKNGSTMRITREQAFIPQRFSEVLGQNAVLLGEPVDAVV